MKKDKIDWVIIIAAALFFSAAFLVWAIEVVDLIKNIGGLK